MALCGAVLAAGAAERFGAPKLLLPAGPGETVLSRTVKAMAQAVDGQVFVVVPQASGLHRAALAATSHERLTLVENARSAEGLGASVAVAAMAAAAADAEGLLLMPADLPYLRPANLSRLAARFAAERPWAAAAHVRDRPQAPAVFSPAAIAQLAGATGPRGAQALLTSPAGPISLEPVAPEELLDLDSWTAYAVAAQSLGWASEAAPAVAWMDARVQISESDLVWSLGPSTRAYFHAGSDATEIRGWRREDRIELSAGGEPAAGLRLLRAAALTELARGTG